MNWDELTDIWHHQPQERVPEAQFEILRKTFEKKSRRLAGVLFWRDLVELLAAVFVTISFGMAAIERGKAGWPLWISTVLVIWVAVSFLKERVRAHRKKTGPHASLLEKIDADIAELRHQRRILLKVGTWYLGPLFLSWFIAMASTRFHGLGGHLRTPFQMAAYFTGVLMLFWLIGKLNKRAVRKKIEPRIADLVNLKDNLVAGN